MRHGHGINARVWPPGAFLNSAGIALLRRAGLASALGVVLWCASVVCPATAGAGDEQVYLTPDEAPHAIFPEGTEILKRVVPITPALRSSIENLIAPTQPSLWEGSIPIYIVSRDGKPVGYAVLVNEIGKHRPITFVVGVTPEETVKGVEIMVYREPKGGEVRMKGFLRQYRGKDLNQPILTGRDVTSISGATLSVRAVNRGIKKALAIVHLVYGSSRSAQAPVGNAVP